MTIEELKQATGYRAAEHVRSGMVIGLGSGSTARYATLRIGELLRQGQLEQIVAIPTSNETADLAREAGIPLSSLDEHPEIALTIDGADEVDPDLNLIKGHGGFLLREKVVAAATQREIIVVDDSKLVDQLGTKFAVPVEVIRFAQRPVWRALEATGARVTQRMRQGQPYITDEGNVILDCTYPGIADAAALEQALNAIPGVVENGLFLNLAQTVIVASPSGIRVLER